MSISRLACCFPICKYANSYSRKIVPLSRVQYAQKKPLSFSFLPSEEQRKLELWWRFPCLSCKRKDTVWWIQLREKWVCLVFQFGWLTTREKTKKKT